MNIALWLWRKQIEAEARLIDRTILEFDKSDDEAKRLVNEIMSGDPIIVPMNYNRKARDEM